MLRLSSRAVNAFWPGLWVRIPILTLLCQDWNPDPQSRRSSRLDVDAAVVVAVAAVQVVGVAVVVDGRVAAAGAVLVLVPLVGLAILLFHGSFSRRKGFAGRVPRRDGRARYPARQQRLEAF